MTETKTWSELRVTEVIEQYGQCLELVSIDPHCNDITVALYSKQGVLTVWTYSRKPGVEDRIRAIRNQLIALGGLAPMPGTDNQAKFPCGTFHRRLLKFLMMQAVEKPPNYTVPGGEMTIKDTKTPLTLTVLGEKIEDRWIYQLSATGEAPNLPLRLRAVVAGFMRYGEMEKVGDTAVSFSCGHRHDQLVRVLLPYSRNISAVEDMMETAALRGQLTTGTAGFTPT